MTKRKKIFVIFLVIALIIFGFALKKRILNYSKSQEEISKISNAGIGNGSCNVPPVQTFQDCTREILEVGADDSSKIYEKLRYLKTDPDPEKNDFTYARNLMILHYSCKLVNGKDEKVLVEAKKYVQQAANFPGNNNEIVENKFDSLFEGKITLPYLSVSENIGFGDREKICPDKLPQTCKTLLQADPGRDKKNIDNNCESLCSTMKKYDENKDLALKELSDDSLWQSSSGKLNKNRIGFGYRVGGKDLALKMCEQYKDVNKQQRVNCINTVYNIDASNITCSDADQKLADFVCGKISRN